MKLLILAFFFGLNSQAQEPLLSDIDYTGSKMTLNMGFLKNTKCKKRVSGDYRDQIVFKTHLVNGVSQCEEPVFEKFCTISHEMKLEEYRSISQSDHFICRIRNTYDDIGVHYIEFEQTYCPKIECHMSLLDLFSGYSINNFRHNMGKFLIELDY